MKSLVHRILAVTKQRTEPALPVRFQYPELYERSRDSVQATLSPIDRMIIHVVLDRVGAS